VWPLVGAVRLTPGGVLCPRTTPSAPNCVSLSPSCIRDLVTLLRESVIGMPVFCSAVRISATVAVGLADLSSAHAPATCAEAMEVPFADAKPPPGTDEVTPLPGASRLRKVALFEKLEIAPCLVVEPTLIAVDMHAGAVVPVEAPLLP